MTTPYCYLLGWPELNKWYYGVRYANNCDPSDLLKIYFTSSKKVKQIINEHGLPSIVEIRKIFTADQINEAREWEHRVLRRMKVIEKNMWINQTHNKSRPPYAMYGDDNHMRKPEHRKRMSENSPTKRPEIAAKISEKAKGKPHPWQLGENNVAKHPEISKKISERLIGRSNYWLIGDRNHMKTQEHRDRLSQNNPMYDQKNADKLSKVKTGIKHKIKICPHCQKSGGFANMTRYHFENCKKLVENDQEIGIAYGRSKEKIAGTA